MFKTQHERDAAPPPHPGEVLREDYLSRLTLGYDVAQRLARHMMIDVETLQALLAEDIKIDGALAAKLGAAFETGPRYWLALQMQYDLWTAAETATSAIVPLRLTSQAQKLG